MCTFVFEKYRAVSSPIQAGNTLRGCFVWADLITLRASSRESRKVTWEPRERRRECAPRGFAAHSRVLSRLSPLTINGELASRLWTPGTGLLNETEKFLPILTLATWKSEGVVTIILRKVWTPEIFLRREKAKPKATPVFKAFWHDITSAMLVSHKNKTAAMLVHQTF